MADQHIRSIAIVGGGPAGWMAAAVLARMLKPGSVRIALIDAPIVGDVAEGTVPAIRRLHDLLGFEEADLVSKTRATFKLGAAFRDWGKPGDCYFHGFGTFGAKLETVAFQHYWLKRRQAGDRTSFEDYSTACVAARLGRFAHPAADKRSVLSLFSYAYHVDAALYADYLRAFALAHGVIHVSHQLRDVVLRGDDGFIDVLVLNDGERFEADFYLDCTGGQRRLIGQALKVGEEDWRQYLPCDRAIVAAAENSGPPPPYSEMSACEAGWRWRIPLQDRAQEGLAYCSADKSDDRAAATLSQGLALLGEPRVLALPAGRPTQFWVKNCLALVDTMPPLEATRLHLVQTGLARFFTLFPDRACNPRDAEEYNRLTIEEHERVRDLLILHFKANARDEPFWRRCREMSVPEELARRIALFEASGRVLLREAEHFDEASWLSVLIGQGIAPRAYDPLADIVDAEAMGKALRGMARMIRDGVESMPRHEAFVARMGAAR